MNDNYIFPFLWMRGEEEEILRNEIGKIHECGIRAICVEARPHDDFCGPGWWHDMDIVLDEARKRDMKVWILDDKHFPTGYAAGLIETTYPERRKWYLADTTVDLFGGIHERTLHVSRMQKPVIGYWQLGQPTDEEERKNNRLAALVATRFTDKDRFSPEVVDLTDTVEGEFATFCLPEGQWRVHAIYKTRTDGGNETYINMLDAVSAHTQIEGVYEAHYKRYPEEFGKTIAGFFSDEPELGNTSDISFDDRLGKKGMALPWSDELEQMLKDRCGDSYRESLVHLFADTTSSDDDRCPQMRYDYMDCVTRLYEKNFSSAIGDWCREHGVEYIGHVVEDNGTHSRLGHGPGHWFRAMTGQDMAGIDVIGSQVIFGAPVQIRRSMGGLEVDGEFFHYILGKMGASAGHLDPRKKGRTMCELFGAYGWNFGVRDMRYLLDHLLCRGVNHLVPHAFSMAEYPDPDCPPHFYARGNNGQFSWFAQLMKYANRMCHLLNGGTHVASIAVLYDGEADWTGDHMAMEKIGRILMQHQMEFDVVSADMLNCPENYNGSFDGNILTLNGVRFETLIIPYAQYLPEGIARFIRECNAFQVIFTDGYPERFLKDRPAPEKPEQWKDNCVCVKYADLPECLKASGFSRISLQPAFEMLSVYHYKKTGQVFMLMNESPDLAFDGKVTLPTTQPLYVYNGDLDRYERLETNVLTRSAQVSLRLEPGQSIVIMEGSQVPSDRIASVEEVPWQSFAGQIRDCRKRIDLSEGWDVSLFTAKDLQAPVKTLHMETLQPVSCLEPAFSGIIRYARTFDLDKVPASAFFRADSVFEVMRVSVNGKEAGIRMTPPYQTELTGLLKKGENQILVEVANTPGRDQIHRPYPPFDFLHEAMEPSGMFGAVEIYMNY